MRFYHAKWYNVTEASGRYPDDSTISQLHDCCETLLHYPWSPNRCLSTLFYNVVPGQAGWQSFERRGACKEKGWHSSWLRDLLEVFVLDISCSRHLCLMMPLSLDLAPDMSESWQILRLPAVSLSIIMLNWGSKFGCVLQACNESCWGQ